MYRATRQFRLQQCTETLRDHKTAALLLRNGAESITFQSIKHYYCQREVKKCAAQQLAVQAAGASKPVFVEVDTDLYVNALSRANLISTPQQNCLLLQVGDPVSMPCLGLTSFLHSYACNSVFDCMWVSMPCLGLTSFLQLPMWGSAVLFLFVSMPCLGLTSFLHKVSRQSRGSVR